MSVGPVLRCKIYSQLNSSEDTELLLNCGHDENGIIMENSLGAQRNTMSWRIFFKSKGNKRRKQRNIYDFFDDFPDFPGAKDGVQGNPEISKV